MSTQRSNTRRSVQSLQTCLHPTSLKSKLERGFSTSQPDHVAGTKSWRPNSLPTDFRSFVGMDTKSVSVPPALKPKDRKVPFDSNTHTHTHRVLCADKLFVKCCFYWTQRAQQTACTSTNKVLRGGCHSLSGANRSASDVIF